MKPSMIDLIWAPAARILKSTLAVISLVMPLAMIGGPAEADFTTAMAAYERADYATAVGEFGSLAAQGDAESQYMLGYLYAIGRGTIQDHVEAHKWLNLAAAGGQAEAAATRDRLARSMTPRQVARAQRLARNWQPQAAQAPVLAEAPAPMYERRLFRAEIADIQSALARLGYDPGPVDGAMGRRTRQAIRQYQSSHSLPVDGRATLALHGRLTGRLAPQASPGAPQASPGASEASPRAPEASPRVPQAPAPAPGPAQGPAGEDAAARLAGALRPLIDAAARRKTADERFIQDLRDILDR